MSDYRDTSHAERMTIDKIVGLDISDIEVANKMLSSMWERDFVDYEQKSISAEDAKEIGRIIYVAMRLIDNATSNYHFSMGHYQEYDLQHFTKYAQRIMKAAEAEKAFEAARKAGCHEAIRQADDLDNDKAVELLTAAVMSKEATT